MPRVLNKRTDQIPPDAVYVGRPTKWGNPFKITDPLLPSGLSKHEKNQMVTDEYRRYIQGSKRLLATLPELKGRDLVCWCSPLPCHADVLLELANKEVNK